MLPTQEQAQIHRERAYRLFNETRINEAIAELESAIRLDSRDAGAWRLLAEIYGVAGFYEPAASYIQKCLQEDHTYLEGWVMLANIYTQIGGHFLDLALEQLEQAPSHDSADIHYLFGNIYAQKGEVDLAQQHLKKALELDPNHKFARHDLAAVSASQ
ncbi:MAG: tetratricopeptide repeat protein [Armatimonadetes bacterium]|nr:tetratricopeptide repeat protein [Armatimonadota bacterium]